MDKNGIMIDYCYYTAEELEEILDDLCALNDFQKVSYRVDQRNRCIIITCQDPSTGNLYHESVEFDEFNAFAPMM